MIKGSSISAMVEQGAFNGSPIDLGPQGKVPTPPSSHNTKWESHVRMEGVATGLIRGVR